MADDTSFSFGANVRTGPKKPRKPKTPKGGGKPSGGTAGGGS